jgi:hypothetical protein
VITLLIILLTLTAFLLVMRFIQPELIYGIRRGLVMVSTNKAFIDKMAGRSDVEDVFRQQLMREARYETRTYDEIFILQDRIVKISELYRLLDLRRRLVKDQRPQVCIVELGGLLTNLGRQIDANPEHNSPVIKAGALLEFIGNGVRASQNELPFESEDEIDQWLIDNPISIEQVIELMIASVVGLAHRQQATRAEASQLSRIESLDVWSEIKKLEKRLRLLVRFQLQDKYKTEDEIYNRVRESLGEDSYQECLRRMEKVRKQASGVALDFLEFVYLGQLETLIFKEWDTFRDMFGEKLWLKKQVEKIIHVRNEEAHNRHVSADDKKMVIGYCSEIWTRIENYQAGDTVRRAAK